MKRSLLPEPAVFGFLLPNFLGFCAFLLFPIVLSAGMSLTNWSLKPAVELEYLGMRNFTDLLGFRALQAGQEAVGQQYVAAAIALLVGLVATLWAVVANWRGVKIGGVLLAAMGAVMLGQKLAVATAGWTHLPAAVSAGPWRLEMGGGQGTVIAGLIFLLGGLAVTRREEGTWWPGAGTLGPLILLAAAAALWALNGPMWAAHQPRDARFWQFLYNTLYLMMAIPFSIAGSLCLALLLNERFPLGGWAVRIAGTLLCGVCGAVTFALLWFGLGWQNLALLGGLLWAMAAMGVAFNIVTFRTIFYLPTFTSGVALMVLWKALYNPQTGPINVALGSVLEWFGVNAATAADMLPKWLADVTWSKPSLIFMGIWTGIGGTNMLLYLAGLSNVPPELLDAAQVDGAGRWARFRHVIWPQLAPTTFFITVMSIIGGLQGGFEEARVMTQGGPAGSTTTLSYYVYNKLFEELDLGYAAAISWVLFAFIFIATAINWRFGRELEVVE
jgi:multiple sugar transport system permease protein